MSDDPVWLTEPRDDRGRWTSGGSSSGNPQVMTAPPPDRVAEDRQDAMDRLLPNSAARMAYAVQGAVGHLAPAIRDRVSQYIDRGGKADLSAVLGAYARGGGMSDEHFRAAFGLGASVTGAVMRNLRNAAAGIAAARTLEAMRSAAGQLADALTAIGPSRLGQIIGGARAGVAKVDTDNLEKMAGVLQAEAGSHDDQVAMEAIGHTILNRMRRNGTALVADVAGGYARPKLPTKETVALAGRLLDGTSVDPTGGATHFYSPQRMAKEGGERVRRCRRRLGICAQRHRR